MKKKISLLLVAIMLLTMLFGCSDSPEEPNDVNSKLDTTKNVTITVAGAWDDFKALETVGAEFTKKYPNCEIVYESIQDYSKAILKRLDSDTDKVDIFITNNIQSESPELPYALELNAHSDTLDLSNTFEGLIKNFTYKESGSAGAEKLYAIPFGAELRGMYVNKTLLSKIGIAVPKNRTEFMAACAKLLEAGYIPIQANPSNASQQLLYPYVCNLVANSSDYTKTYETVNKKDAGMVEIFNDPMQFMYDLTDKGYYNYKKVENDFKRFTDTSDEAISRDFLNIVASGDSFAKKDDIGEVAFMPSIKSLESVIEKTKDDYHSTIDYEFVLSPVSDEGGYAYMSPSSAFAINKNSDNTEWALEFFDFLFSEEINKKFSEELNIIPNTKTAFDVITAQYNIPATQISHLGQVTFDYDFYGVISKTLRDISKANNPKYMQENADGTTTIYPYDHFVESFKKSLTE